MRYRNTKKGYYVNAEFVFFAEPVFVSFGVPRKNPFPKREREICQRLREFRAKTKLSRVAFADQAGMDATLLRSYELGRSQLNYHSAYKLITTFGINPEWLATRNGMMVKPINLPPPDRINARPRELFSAIYFRELVESPWPLEVTPLIVPSKNARWLSWEMLRCELKAALAHIPDDQVGSFVEKMQRLMADEIAAAGYQLHDLVWQRELAMDKTEADTERDYAKPATGQPYGMTDYLDTGKSGGIVAGMKAKDVPTWAKLKKTIVSLTKAHGQKAALADELGVSRQVLGNWLADGEQGAPNAETTLRLFKWSLDPKRQAK